MEIFHGINLLLILFFLHELFWAEITIVRLLPVTVLILVWMLQKQIIDINSILDYFIIFDLPIFSFISLCIILILFLKNFKSIIIDYLRPYFFIFKQIIYISSYLFVILILL